MLHCAEWLPQRRMEARTAGFPRYHTVRGAQGLQLKDLKRLALRVGVAMRMSSSAVCGTRGTCQARDLCVPADVTVLRSYRTQPPELHEAR
jgi:hypothetical protein